MNLVSALLGEQRSTPLTPAGWRELFGGSTKSSAGVTVTVDAALRNITVFSCIRLIAETTASLPLPTYRRLEPRGKEKARDYPLYPVLHDQANEEMTAMEVRENLAGHLLAWARAYAEIERNGRGDILGLWPLRPDRCTLMRAPDKRLWLSVTVPGESKPVFLPPGRFLRIRGFSLDELYGMSLIAQGREEIGLATATQQYGAKHFSNGSQPGGVLETDKRLDTAAAKRLAESWQAAHSGLDNAHRVAVLEEGTKWHQVGLSPENSQFLETRKLSRSEIAGLFHVQPHLIGDLEHATYTNIEHQGIEFVVHTLRPWLVRMEQALQRDCIPLRDRPTYFAEHNVDGLLRGDYKTRMEGYAIGRQNGFYCADDIMEMENRNPLPDGLGRIYLVNGNMIPIDKAGQQQRQPQPAPVADAPEGDNDDDEQAD